MSDEWRARQAGYDAAANEIGEAATRLQRKARAIQAAQLSLNQRVREFLKEWEHGMDPSPEPVRLAMAELDRVAPRPITASAPSPP